MRAQRSSHYLVPFDQTKILLSNAAMALRISENSTSTVAAYYLNIPQMNIELNAMRKCASTPSLRYTGDLTNFTHDLPNTDSLQDDTSSSFIDSPPATPPLADHHHHDISSIISPPAIIHNFNVPMTSPPPSGTMEVYVVLRNFQELAGGIFHRVPIPLRNGIRDCGICHYMTVFRTSDGSFVQFDFGPSVGGDIHLARGPFARLFSKTQRPGARRIQGKVRESSLTHIPSTHMYVGRTHLSLADIREWNDIHASAEYELNRSDCRHYVNSLVRYTTGMERATVTALRHQWVRNKRRKNVLAACVVQLGQYMTDVAHWGSVRAMGQATAAVLMTLTGHQALARLQIAGPLIKTVQRRLLPMAETALMPIRQALVRRPVYGAMGTAAVASYAASGSSGSDRTAGAAPAVARGAIGIGSRVAVGVRRAVRAAASLAEQVNRNTMAATQRTRRQAMALAGAASRSAAQLMMPGHAGRSRAGVMSIARTDETKRHAAVARTAPSAGNGVGSRAHQLALLASRR